MQSLRVPVCVATLLILALTENPASTEPLHGVSREEAFCPSYLVIEDFLVNDDTTSFVQWHSEIAMDRKGYFVIAWGDFRKNGQSPDVYAQRYDSLGSPLGSNFRVNDVSGTFLYSWRPSVACDRHGNFVVTWWFAGSNPTYDEDIYAQRYDSLGNPVGPNFRVNDTLDGYQEHPSIAMNGKGRSVVAWGDRRNPVYLHDVYAQRYDSSGNPIGANFRVSDDGNPTNQRFPSVAMSDYGRFVICWRDSRNGSDCDIYAQLYDSAGSALGPNFRVNDDPFGAYQYFPSAGMDRAGNFVITWEDHRHGGLSQADTYAQRYDSLGNPLGPNFMVNDDPDSSDQYWASVAMDAGGKFVITWCDSRRRPYVHIYAQHYHEDGSLLGVNHQVDNDTTWTETNFPDVVVDATRIYYTWTDERRRRGLDIYAKMVDWDWPGVGVETQTEARDGRQGLTLSNCQPNPFAEITEVRYGLGVAAHVTLRIYDLAGRAVKTLVVGRQDAGDHAVLWDGRDDIGRRVACGVYFYRLEVGSLTRARKIVVLK